MIGGYCFVTALPSLGGSASAADRRSIAELAPARTPAPFIVCVGNNSASAYARCASRARDSWRDAFSHRSRSTRRLGAVERLDLRLVVDREHDRVLRRVDVEADDLAQL